MSERDIFVNGDLVDSFVFDQDLGSAIANKDTATTRLIEGRNIEAGAAITIVGQQDKPEPLRIDFFEFMQNDDFLI